MSRATLSRLERTEISPTAALLGKLCSVYGRTMSRLLSEVEEEQPQLVRVADQTVWVDAESGFVRRSVSPPDAGLRAEVVEGALPPDATIAYEDPPVPGVEQHIWVLEGELEITVQGETHVLCSGDCLRFRLWGASKFRCPGPAAARYAIVVVPS